jgi:hypothetical protein
MLPAAIFKRQAKFFNVFTQIFNAQHHWTMSSMWKLRCGVYRAAEIWLL